MRGDGGAQHILAVAAGAVEVVLLPSVVDDLSDGILGGLVVLVPERRVLGLGRGGLRRLLGRLLSGLSRLGIGRWRGRLRLGRGFRLGRRLRSGRLWVPRRPWPG